MLVDSRKLLDAILALIIALGLASCDKLPELLYGNVNKEDPEEEVVASVTPAKTSLGAESGSIFVTVKASGDWTLGVEYPSGVSEWGRPDPSSGTGIKGDVRFRYDANPGEARSAVLILKNASGETIAQAEVRQMGKGEAEQMMGQYGYDIAPMDWLELPACKSGDGLDLLIHDMSGGKYISKSASGTRNWSCYWDYKEHLSLWVAYPLNNSLKGSGSRSNDWGYDALLPVSIQPNLTNGSYGGGWTRGHQLPSADRLTSYAANASTFVPTNMTPQDYDFNCGIWANLEGAVRGYAGKADTLYVVTGCRYDNSTTTSGSSSGFRVKIPTYYFKALLYRGSQSAAKATGGFMAAAFYLPHTENIANGNYKEYIMTIDQLEDKTGIDFFPNLASVVGEDNADKIESKLESWW
ncbi:MAG: DNA/RNA non-specific endonuclease [Bacteroidales bacterium]|nr:DNA/RNA non-specific endonuclease [Bacteroidales bacterium]